MEISLRPVNMADAQLLFEWRNDPLTRQASLNQAELVLADHVQWLSATLAQTGKLLYIAEVAGEPVGTVRAFANEDDSYELSWTVAPTQRGRGLGKHMVRALANLLDSPVVARVRADNPASRAIAESAGLSFISEQDGVLLFRRERRVRRAGDE